MSANHSCRVLVLLLASSILGGCAHDVATTVDVAGMPNAEIALRRSVDHVDKEMGEIGRMRRAPRQGSAVVPAELQKIVAFEWEGPIEGAVKKLAGEVGYDVVVELCIQCSVGVDRHQIRPPARLRDFPGHRQRRGRPRDRAGRCAASSHRGDLSCLNSRSVNSSRHSWPRPFSLPRLSPNGSRSILSLRLLRPRRSTRRLMSSAIR